MGVNGTQHDINGNPVINKKFPDMQGLVNYGHSKGLKVGWYENGCACVSQHVVLLSDTACDLSVTSAQCIHIPMTNQLFTCCLLPYRGNGRH